MNRAVERWRSADDVAFESAGDEVVALNLRTGEYYRLNAVAGEIWRRLLRPRSLAEIAAHLLQRYDVPRKTLASDLSELMGDLERHGLVARERS